MGLGAGMDGGESHLYLLFSRVVNLPPNDDLPSNSYTAGNAVRCRFILKRQAVV